MELPIITILLAIAAFLVLFHETVFIKEYAVIICKKAHTARFYKHYNNCENSPPAFHLDSS